MTEHYLITRLKKLRPVFNAFFSRTATVEHVLPKMSLSVSTIVKEAQAIQTGLGHLEEAHFDSQALSDEFAHLVTFATNLPVTLEWDKGFWGYALNLVDLKVFQEGAEEVELEKLQELNKSLQEIITIKQELKSQ
jgi:hypothetical protein